MTTTRSSVARKRRPSRPGKPAPDPRRIQRLLLGDEAVALGCLHAGLSSAYAYPGTPSTEILEYLIEKSGQGEAVTASWCTNEKTAYEQALGTSMAGKRALVAMKHVGLNVALDPFMSSALVAIHGGLVLAVADDPGMHSSQNEQDSRCLADFAHIPCLEPSTQQEAYDMARDAFALSEHFRVPVMIRLVTRLAHSRAVVTTNPPLTANPAGKTTRANDWNLLPVFARRLWRQLLEDQENLRAWSERCRYTPLFLSDGDGALGVITTGIARNYYLENAPELEQEPSHLHVGAYPLPTDKIRALAGRVERILVLEEGYPYLERLLRGLLPASLIIHGKLDGTLPPDGELDPDRVREALDLPPHPRDDQPRALPSRPPQLCQGCPHRDAFAALKQALPPSETSVVTGDIGCYTLGALPPLSALESCVCMGASIGMAKGAAEAGMHPAVAVIGDSTFLHSGVTGLMDAVAADTDMIVLVLANEAVAMTGAQAPVLPAERLHAVALGVGVDPDHCHLYESSPGRVEELAGLIRKEMAHPGLSVIISVRECIERARRVKAEAGAKA